uniref:Uncharacterized protein n=1 Tax=Rhizophora mucronata TaxID=61149 RepID=A0A2P2NEY1_RHIMU
MCMCVYTHLFELLRKKREGLLSQTARKVQEFC